MTLFCQWLATQQDLPGRRLHQPGQQAQQAGLAAAVGATDLQHVTGAQLEIELFEQQAPVALAGQARGLEVKGHGFALSL
ncbi:hypothetical protein D3C71_2014010 [compost metagenome]